MRNKDILNVLVVTAAILLLPLVAMQFTSEVNWDLFDFAITGLLLISAGMLIVIAVRRMDSINKRIAVMVAILTVFLLIWAELAVGVIENLFRLLFRWN